jgi:hypothetical protein
MLALCPERKSEEIYEIWNKNKEAFNTKLLRANVLKILAYVDMTKENASS